jgi:hypothetical protein
VTDIVERLRERSDLLVYSRTPEPLMREAADDIERLRDYEAHFWATVAEAERLRLQWTGMKSEVQVCRENTERLRKAATDALAGWMYIRRTHGDLYGVGWDRVQSALVAALNASEGAKPKEPPPSPDIRGTSIRGAG